MKRPMKNFWIFLLGLFGLHGGAVFAGSQGVLCAADIKGDSKNPSAPGCADILAWSWGLSTLTQSGGGGGGGVILPSFQDLSLTKETDSSSDDLFKLAATGVTLSGIVELRQYATCGSGCTSPDPYLTIHMKDVQVTSLNMGGSSGADLPQESLSLHYSQVSFCYTAAKGAQQCFAFDVQNNTPVSPF